MTSDSCFRYVPETTACTFTHRPCKYDELFTQWRFHVIFRIIKYFFWFVRLSLKLANRSCSSVRGGHPFPFFSRKQESFLLLLQMLYYTIAALHRSTQKWSWVYSFWHYMYISILIEPNRLRSQLFTVRREVLQKYCFSIFPSTILDCWSRRSRPE